MKKIFLASSFNDVADLLHDFADNEVIGKTVTFIPTASLAESPRFFVKNAVQSFNRLGVHVDVLEISTQDPDEIKKRIMKNDYIYVSGGNTFYLLQEMKKKRVDECIKQEIGKGKLYIGESAGSMILSPNIQYVTIMDDERKGPMNNDYDALNIVDFFPVPHYGNFPFKKKVKRIMEAYKTINLVPINNHQVILVNGEDYSIKSVR